MILLWGLIEDPPTRMVYSELKEMGSPVFFLNHRDIDETQVNLTFADQISGTISIYDQELPVEEICSCYLRTHDLFDYAGNEGLSVQDERIWSMAMAEDMLWGWAELTDALVINKPSRMASNDSKAFQAAIIEQAGFSVPETLITTSPSSVNAFWEKHGEIIYKSNSSVRSIVKRLTAKDRDRLEDVRMCPTMFQQHIPGTDYRVHVVGTETYACKIHSPADDYRYGENSLESVSLPQAIRERCVKLASTLGLIVGGIDLRQHSNGTWYCFEVNPSPGFSFYETQTGLPIANAIARLLASSGCGARI
jgi:hypothetical protein